MIDFGFFEGVGVTTKSSLVKGCSGKKFRGVIVISFVLLSFLSFFLLVVFLLLLFRYSSENNSEKEKFKYYKFLQIDFHTNHTNRGMITSNRDLENGFEYSEFDDNNHRIVSEFGSVEYFCSGSCFCGEKNNQKMTRSILTNPKVHKFLCLVSSVTVIYAIIHAQKIFSDKCEKELEETCPFSSIHSEVDDCQPIPVVEEEEEDFTTSEEEPKTTKFQCVGRCSSIKLLDRSLNYVDWDDENLINYDGRYHHPKQLSILVQYAIRRISEKSKSFCEAIEFQSDVEVERIGSFEMQEEMALNKFWSVHLMKFCKSSTSYSVEELAEGDFFGDNKSRGLSKIEQAFLRNFMKTSGNGNEMSMCRARKMDPFKNVLHVVCYRLFAKSEWEKGIPYEHNNLRHWKEGYKIGLDKYKLENE